MQIEIYVVKTKLKIWNLGKKRQLKAIKDGITAKMGGITVLGTKSGEWVDKGKIYNDKVEIWRILANDYDTVDFKFLKAKISEIKALTGQISQLHTINQNVKPYFT